MTEQNRIVEAFAKALIAVPKGMENAEEKRLQIAELFMPHAFFVQNCAADGQYNSIPYFNLVDKDKLPSGNVVEYSGLRDEHPEYKLAARASVAELRAAVDSVFEASLEGKTLTKAIGVSDVIGSHTGAFIRNPVDYGQPIIKQGRLASSYGDHCHARDLHNAEEGTAEKALWHLFQELVLEDKNNLPPKQWLRQLRLLSGRNVQEMGMALGFKDASGTNYSQYENSVNLSPHNAQIILDKNLLDLSTDVETGRVRDDVRKKFLGKFGHFTGETEQIAAAVKAMAIEHARHIAHGGKLEDSNIAKLDYSRPEMLLEFMKHKNRIIDTANGKQVSITQTRKEYPELEMPENGDYLNLLPNKRNDLISRAAPELSVMLAKSIALEMAEHAPTLSAFLRRYQQVHGKNMKKIGEAIDVNESRISQLLKDDDSLTFREIETLGSKNVRIRTVEKIISTNAFDLPTGKNGKVHSEVMEAIWKLHHEQEYVSPYGGVVDGASRAGIIKRDGKWTDQLHSSKESPKYRAWVNYWSELSDQEKSSGKVKVDNHTLRKWRDVEGHLLIHHDDLELLEKSKRYRSLVRREKQHSGQAGVAV